MNFAGLRDYQQPHAAHLFGLLQVGSRAFDGSDTGTGKTFVACALARESGVVPLVIAPKSTLGSWHDAAQHVGVGIDAIGYEKVRSKKSEYGYLQKAGSGSRWVWNCAFEFGIFDEVDRCGGDATINSKLLIAAARQFGKLLMMSATAADKPQQLRALGYALGLFTLPEFKWWTFKHGCGPGVFGGIEFSDNPQEREAAMQKISRTIFPALGGRMRKADIPNFPKTVIAAKPLEDSAGKAAALAAELHAAFKRHENEVDADEAHNRDVEREVRKFKKANPELDEREMSEALADIREEKANPLRIMTRTRQALELLKVPDMAELVVDYARTSRVVVFVNFSETIDALRHVLENAFLCDVPVFDGRDQHIPHRDEWRKEFQADQHPCILVNIAAGGIGVGFHGQMDRTTLISPCYNARQIKQVFGRVQRDGGGFSQQFWIYFADTREAEIASTVMAKLDNLDQLNDGHLN
jgi:hypothetical protein